MAATVSPAVAARQAQSLYGESKGMPVSSARTPSFSMAAYTAWAQARPGIIFIAWLSFCVLTSSSATITARNIWWAARMKSVGTSVSRINSKCENGIKPIAQPEILKTHSVSRHWRAAKLVKPTTPQSAIATMKAQWWRSLREEIESMKWPRLIGNTAFLFQSEQRANTLSGRRKQYHYCVALMPLSGLGGVGSLAMKYITAGEPIGSAIVK